MTRLMLRSLSFPRSVQFREGKRTRRMDARDVLRVIEMIDDRAGFSRWCTTSNATMANEFGIKADTDAEREAIKKRVRRALAFLDQEGLIIRKVSNRGGKTFRKLRLNFCQLFESSYCSMPDEVRTKLWAKISLLVNGSDPESRVDSPPPRVGSNGEGLGSRVDPPPRVGRSRVDRGDFFAGEAPAPESIPPAPESEAPAPAVGAPKNNDKEQRSKNKFKDDRTIGATAAPDRKIGLKFDFDEIELVHRCVSQLTAVVRIDGGNYSSRQNHDMLTKIGCLRVANRISENDFAVAIESCAKKLNPSGKPGVGIGYLVNIFKNRCAEDGQNLSLIHI